MNITKPDRRKRHGKISSIREVLMTPARLYALISLGVLIFGGKHVW